MFHTWQVLLLVPPELDLSFATHGSLATRLPHLLSSLVLVTGGVDDGPGIRVKTKAIEHKPTGVTHSALCLLNRVLQFILCSFDQDAVMDWICGITATTNLRRGCY